MRQGFTPIVLDNLSNGYKEFVQWGPFIKGDIQDTHLVEGVIVKYKPLA